jgi:valyl-tRNA synthetase
MLVTASSSADPDERLSRGRHIDGGRRSPESQGQRAHKQIALLQKEVARTQQKLSNPDFVAKAPPDVLTEHRERLERVNPA